MCGERNIRDCSYRVDAMCCHSMNYLRPYQCNGFCILEAEKWLRSVHPEMTDDEIKSKVLELSNSATHGHNQFL